MAVAAAVAEAAGLVVSRRDVNFVLRGVFFTQRDYPDEVNALMSSLDSDTGPQEGEDEIPETPEEPISRPGDLWLLGSTSKVMTVALIAPIAMEEKLRFAIREGGRTVGAGVVSKIIK